MVVWLASVALAGCGGSSTAPTLKLSAAEAAVRSRGYYPVDPSAYEPGAALSVILGVRKGSGDGTAQRAFFFADGRLVGTDTRDDSSGIRIAFARPAVIALEYALYDPRDPQCCPSAGSATVPYRWEGERLRPEKAVPPSSFSAFGSRR